eukprot:g6438.t1
MLGNTLCSRQRQLTRINDLPLYPTEAMLWDPDLVPLDEAAARGSAEPPSRSGGGGAVLALPKLNMQFLTLTDYLLRNWTLYRLESAHEIREDLVDAITRVDARVRNGARSTAGSAARAHEGLVWNGWSRMALPIDNFDVTEVGKPNVGQMKPSAVLAELSYSLAAWDRHSGGGGGRGRATLRREWDELREHDVVFLVALVPPAGPDATGAMNGAAFSRASPAERVAQRQAFPRYAGVVAVRGAQIVELRDEAGTPMNDAAALGATRRAGAAAEGGSAKAAATPGSGSRRTLVLKLDESQYARDLNSGVAGQLYEGAGQHQAAGALNMIVRREGKENNFRAVLQTIRDLMNAVEIDAEAALPSWLHDVFLGYGDPGHASPSCLTQPEGKGDAGRGNVAAVADPAEMANERDYADTFVDAEHLRQSFPGAKLTFVGATDGAEMPPPPYRLRFDVDSEAHDAAGKAKPQRQLVVHAAAYRAPHAGPFPQAQPRRNSVAFTPTQVRAIRAAMAPGLTLVVGPPGTGKTDVAVQAIANLYVNFPSERLLLITHSNQALNDLFVKLLQRNIDPRHMIRLGSGERQLRDTIQHHADDHGLPPGLHYDFSKRGRVDYALMRRLELLAEVGRLARSLQPPVSELEWSRDDAAATCEAATHFELYHIKALELAEGCFQHLRCTFAEIADTRAFELLRSQSQRADYLMMKQARIVAMTCTHAALVRARLLQLGFTYDTVVMEEAAQVLEIETFVPLCMQRRDATLPGGRLKRVVLIGDHHQLPPVVKNPAFQKYGRLDQSLFARLLRLGVPNIELDAQGRARPEIAALYSWRYCALADLPAVRATSPPFGAPNAGFAHTVQLVDVADFQGSGESAPTSHFYQNLGEAEYVVATYRYMRICGYPASKISILTTYNGQKHLIRDVVSHRCGALGMPAVVETVDRYQGQQNDYVLLSLVRTRAIGHLRDPRRLIVAMSRAR